MKNKCLFCMKREGKVFFSMTAIDPCENGLEFSHKTHACYQCLMKIFKSLVDIINEQKGIIPKKNTILPSMPWSERQRMGKISKDELFDLKIWLNKIKNIKDFKEGL